MTAPGASSDHPVPTPRSASVSRAGASALWRDVASAAAADPGFAWALLVGVVLIALGLLGFVPNPLVGAPSAAWGTPLLLTGDAHDVIHLVGGAIAIHAALGLSRARRDVVLIGLGAAALILLAVGLLDGRWFGIAPYAVGLGDQLLHLVVGLGSLVMGLAGSGAVNVPIVTGAYRRAALAASGVAVTAGIDGADDGTTAREAPAAPESDAGPEAAPAAPEAAARPGPAAEAEAAPAGPEAAAEAEAAPAGPEAAAEAEAAPAGPEVAPAGPEAAEAELVEAPTEPLGLRLDDETPADIAPAPGPGAETAAALPDPETLAAADDATDAPADISAPPDPGPADAEPVDAEPADAAPRDDSLPPDETHPQS